MRILAIQLARTVDILQTLPALAGLRARYPDCHIDLVVRETFAEAALLSPHVNRVIGMPTRAILAPMLANGGASTESVKVKCLAHLITWLADEFLEATHHMGSYDLTLNFTFSESSSYLSELIPSKEKRGLKRAYDGAYAVTDAWGHYIYSQVLRKNLNILHMSDLYARLAGTVIESVTPVTKGYDSSHELGELVIGLHLGPSHSEKSLNPKIWGILAQGILDGLPEAHLVLFGGKEDKKRANVVTAALAGNDGEKSKYEDRCTNLVGRIRFSENVHWIKRCNYMIAPDTYMNQLAPMCDVKTLNISVGSPRVQEMGPYGEGHMIFRPIDTTLEQGIEPLVEAVISAVMGDPIPSTVPAFKTRLTGCSDETFRNEVIPANFEKNEIENFFEQAYYLLAEFRNAGRYEDLPVPTIGSPNQVSRLQQFTTCFDALCATKELASFGQKYCMQMIENCMNREVLQELGPRITEVESMLKTLQESVPYIKPLIDSWEVAKENVIGERIIDLASLTEGTFRELIQNIDMVLQLMEISMNTAKETLDQGTWSKLQNDINLRGSEHENNLN